MEIIIFLIPIAILLVLTFLGGFVWMTVHGQYDDLETPGQRMLLDENEQKTNNQTQEGKL